jgi:hypothetical protein
MDNQTLIAKQTMEPVDDDEVVMEAPKKVTDDEMKEIVDTVIYKHLDTIGSEYKLVKMKTLLKVVTTKLNEDNIHFDVDEDQIKPKIENAFSVWQENYINKKRRMHDSNPKSGQSDAKKPKYDTDHSGSKESDATMIEPFKPVTLGFKRPEKQVEQSPISIMRSDRKKKDLLNSWGYDASLQLYQKTMKNHQTKAVYTYIMDNFWVNAKKDHPEWNLDSYEVKANDWNREHESYRNQKKKK